ncbi:MAG: efflux RND transporter permease subunit [Desulfobacteraceae bacterium]|jgi:predicted RND superfamily exporter protein|nr:efflux RND transporter permease subunit [Desulfobacteraceae bacterium]
MNNIRNRIELQFAAFARTIYRHRLKTILLMMIAIGALLSRLPTIVIDTSTESFLHEQDPALLTYNDFRDQFGRDEVVIVALKPKQVFDVNFLKTLAGLHAELEENIPYLDDITSLINARNTRGEGDLLIVEDLLENWPETDDQLQAIKQRALSNPMYENMLISEDGAFTTIIIRTQSHSSMGQKNDIMEGFDDFDADIQAPAGAEKRYLTDEENTEVVQTVEKIIEKYRSDDLPIYLAGSPAVVHFLKEAMMSDMSKFMLLAILTVSLLLYIMFRRITGVVLPMLIVILSLLSTISLMAIFGVPIKIPTEILPSFILAVGVGSSVHILAIFFHRLRKTKNKEESIIFSIGHSGLAVMMTNLTTAAGLMSFANASVAPVAELGIFASAGVVLAFIYTIVLLPPLIAIIPLSNKKTEILRKNNRVMDNVLEKIGLFSTTHPKKILFVSFCIVAIAFAGIFSIRFSHYPLKWLPETSDIRAATEKIDKELNGSLSMEILFKTNRENGLYEPELLNRIETAGNEFVKISNQEFFIGKAWSVTTLLKEINQALNENDPAAYTIPQNKPLIAQEFLLFENSGSDDLEDFVDSQFSMARLTLKVPFVDGILFDPVEEEITAYLDKNFADVDFQITGLVALLAKTFNNTITSMAQSYLIALGVITLMMILLIGRIRIGLLSMIPNLVPIIIMLGVIGWFGFPMDLFTMMVASIAIGLAVDDTIHFMHNFRRYYEQSGDPKKAVFDTLHSTGRAMLVTTVVLSVGFFIYMFASMQNIIRFGFLTGFTILMALASDYFIAPALMVLVNKNRA